MPVPYRHNQGKKGVLKSIWDWFLDPNFGLGPSVDTRTTIPHVHSWEFYNTIRCGWRVEQGVPAGQRLAINLAILDVEKYPAKNETKIKQLRDWERSGYEFVHTSQTVYRCKHHGCGLTKSIDVYAAPVKGDGSGPIMVDFGSRFQNKFTETTRIGTQSYSASGRREVAIEPMKRHGVTPKLKKEPPVVPMED